MRADSMVTYSVPQQAFFCAACMEGHEVPYAVLTNAEAFVSMLETLQLEHADCPKLVSLASNLRSFVHGARRHNLLKNGSPFARA